MKYIIAVAFLIMAVLIAGSLEAPKQAVQCDEVVNYPETIENGITRQAGAVCEVFVAPSATSRVMQTSSVSTNDRL